MNGDKDPYAHIAAKYLGRKGGKAGKGKAKARTSEQARAAALARWEKERFAKEYCCDCTMEQYRAFKNQQHNTQCPECGGARVVDSGGQTPWGEWINIPCPECSNQQQNTK